MKKNLLITICLILAGCSDRIDSTPDLSAKLDTIQAELRAQSAMPRWAVANKREIESAISQWMMARQEEAKHLETLTPETQEKLANYEALQSELMQMRMRLQRARFPGPYGVESTETNADYAALSSRVAEARKPVAEILTRRDRKAAQYRNQFKAEDLIAEYAKDRFDLVVDSSDMGFSRGGVLYQKGGETTDITDGVIKLFNEKSNK